MGWLPQSAFDDKRNAALALTPEQRESLTWDEARKYVVTDTLDMAKWSGLKKAGLTPWTAVAILRGIERNPQPEKK